MAGTGTIDPAGNVGPIGGIQQKLVGARDAGAELMLAPADNCTEVVGNIPGGLTVVPVSRLAQARDTIEKWVADPEAEFPQCGEGLRRPPRPPDRCRWRKSQPGLGARRLDRPRGSAPARELRAD